jgi:hypothetical protein
MQECFSAFTRRRYTNGRPDRIRRPNRPPPSADRICADRLHTNRTDGTVRPRHAAREDTARSGRVIAIEGDQTIAQLVEHVIYIPAAPELLLPILEHFRVRCIVIPGETLRQTDDGEIVWRRSASQVAGGP